MFIDFRVAAPDTEIAGDICILGAGPAGITIARELARTGRDIILIESGGLDFDAATQALYTAESIGRNYPVPEHLCRLRYFGGSTNHWAGYCGPLDSSDFAERPWVPYSGWPITRADLDPYYVRAHELCELGPFAYDTASWTSARRRFHELLPAKLEHAFWQFSPPTRFGHVYRGDLGGAPNVRVYLFANVVELETDAAARTVARVHVRSLNGVSATVRAGRVVLALGGIENARLLLSSDRVRAEGVGNRHDLVGRFFMEHPYLHTGSVLARDAAALLLPAYSADREAGQPVAADFHEGGIRLRCGLKLASEAQRMHGILNAGIEIRSGPAYTGYDALRSIAGDLRRGRWPGSLGGNLLGTIRDADQTARGVWSRIRGRAYEPPTEVVLLVRSEPAPNPDSRVTLGSDRDALGMRRVRVDWQLTPLDRRTVRRATVLVGEELGRLELGRVRLRRWLRSDRDDAAWPRELRGGCHHMGTTRMASDPVRGVVDADCRVHGIDNLYIAGSSVFPTGGFMNPTLTIVALALRLADHLHADPINPAS